MRLGVVHRVYSDAVTLLTRNTARLTEINITCQFADDHQIESSDNFRLERRCIDQLRKYNRGAQIREKIAFLAQTQNCLFRSMLAWQRIVVGTTNRPEQHSIGILRQLQGRRRQRMTMCVERRTTNERRFCFNFQTVASQHVEHSKCFDHDFGADAVAGHDCNLHFKSLVKKPGFLHGARCLIGFDFVVVS